MIIEIAAMIVRSGISRPLAVYVFVSFVLLCYFKCQLHLVASILDSQSSRVHSNFSGTTLLSSLFECLMAPTTLVEMVVLVSRMADCNHMCTLFYSFTCR